jgi:hypothetical protein
LDAAAPGTRATPAERRKASAMGFTEYRWLERELTLSIMSPHSRRVKPMAAVGMKADMKIASLKGRSGLPVKNLRY